MLHYVSSPIFVCTFEPSPVRFAAFSQSALFIAIFFLPRETKAFLFSIFFGCLASKAPSIVAHVVFVAFFFCNITKAFLKLGHSLNVAQVDSYAEMTRFKCVATQRSTAIWAEWVANERRQNVRRTFMFVCFCVRVFVCIAFFFLPARSKALFFL